jgi:heat shock protein HtpX
MAATLKTAMLMAGLTALFMGVGWLLGGATGVVVAFLFAAGTNLFAWWNSDTMVLKMHGARPATGEDGLTRMVADLATPRGACPCPAVYILETDQPNAFATGRSPGARARSRSRAACSSGSAPRRSPPSSRTSLPISATATRSS